MIQRNYFAALAAAAITLSGVSALAQQTWQVSGGVANVALLDSNIKSVDMTVNFSGLVPANTDQIGPAFGLKVSPRSTLTIFVQNGILQEIVKGTVTTSSGLVISRNGRKVSVPSLEIRPNGNLASYGLTAGPAGTKLEYFTFVAGGGALYRKLGKLTMAYYDMLIGHDLALALNQPDLEGLAFGTFGIIADIRMTGGNPNDPDPVLPESNGMEDGPVDVKMSRYGDSTAGTVQQMARSGGRVAFSGGTESCNVGNVNIDWKAKPDVRHPVIGQGMYRLTVKTRNGVNYDRMEMLSVSWLKQGFLALNDPTCNAGGTPACTNSTSGAALNINCTDIYGSSLNATQSSGSGQIRIRTEVNPLTGGITNGGVWSTMTFPDAFTGRLNCLESDLSLANFPGAQFFFEGYYITAGTGGPDANTPGVGGDLNLYNQIANRRGTLSFGSSWTFSANAEGLIYGVILDRWVTLSGASSTTAQPRTEGDAIIAVKVTNLNNGFYHYEYAIFNFNVNRKIREFAVPLIEGSTVQNIEFRDPDADGTNGWNGAVSGPFMVFNTPSSGGTSNPIKWCELYNFSFDANIAPGGNNALRLGLNDAGGAGAPSDIFGTLSSPPPGLVSMNNIATNMGTYMAGNLASVSDSDNSFYQAKQDFGSETEFPIQITMDSTCPITNPSLIELKVESKGDSDSRGVEIQLFDRLNPAWVTIGSGLSGTTKTTITGSTSSSPSRFVDPTTRLIRARINVTDGSSETAQPIQIYIDKAQYRFVR